MRDSTQSNAPGDTAVQVAEYVCGLLKPEEHAQVHILLGRDDQALAMALDWEERLLALVDALPRVQPDSQVRERLQRTLGIGPPPPVQPPSRLLHRPSVVPPTAATPATQATSTAGAAPRAAAVAASPAQEQAIRKTAAGITDTAQGRSSEPNSSPRRPQPDAVQRNLIRKLWFWRLIGLSAASAAIVGFMMPGEPPPPPVQIVKVAPTRAAILQAPGSTSTPGWTATLGPEGNMMMHPLVHTEVPVGSQVLLWTRSGKIPQPRLLGRIDPNRPVQVPAAQLGALADDQLLEITLETDEDAAQGVPNGPILFIGQMAMFGSEGAAGPTTGANATATGAAMAGPSAAAGSISR